MLVKLYNECLRFGVFPRIWKIGSIRVLLKDQNKDPTNVRSYRPVCLLPVLGKLLEKLIKQQLKSVIMHPRFSFKDQFGFREKGGH